MVPRPISTRKLDILYLTFFILHIFIILNVDLVSLYPLSITPEYMLAIRKYYIETYKDRFFASPPGWFRWYLRVEGVYHLPLSAWAAWGIVRDDPIVPLQLLVWAVQTAATTGTCVADFVGWEDVTRQEKFVLAQLYVPYLAFTIFLGTDMFIRIRKQLLIPGGETMRAEAVLIEKNK